MQYICYLTCWILIKKQQLICLSFICWFTKDAIYIFIKHHPQKRFWLFNLKKNSDSWFEKILIYDHLKYLVCEVWFGKFFWGNIGISDKSQGSSMQKLQVSITSQTGVMAKKLWKITILNRMSDIWFGNFFCDAL